ncbi:MAG: universal stress protein [Chloroflexota bacterium]
MSKQKVLVPLDGSEFSRQILPYVRRLFRPDENALFLLRVAQPQHHSVGVVPKTLSAVSSIMSQAVGPMTSGYDDVAEFPDSSYDGGADELRREVRRLERDGYDVSLAVRFGEPAHEIVDFARETDADLVAMASHSRTGVGNIVLGSVPEEVLHNLSIPVLLLRPTWDVAF